MTTQLYRAEVGSHAYGTNTGVSDHDFVEVYIEDPEYITGLSQWDTKFESNEGRTPVGGEDVTVYGFKKWSSLVAAGNPNMIETLFIENEDTYAYGAWNLILANRRAYLSKSAGRKFLGYSNGQRMALAGMRNKRTNRPELVHTHGWDTKFGGHMIRVLLEGIELMLTGELVFPLARRDLILDIRAGNVSKEDGFELANGLEKDLEEAIGLSDLPEKADLATINRMMNDIYQTSWSAND